MAWQEISVRISHGTVVNFRDTRPYPVPTMKSMSWSSMLAFSNNSSSSSVAVSCMLIPVGRSAV